MKIISHVFLCACVASLAVAVPLAGQDLAERATDAAKPAATGAMATSVDARLVVGRAEMERALRARESASMDTVTRPRWHYPAIGAAIGIAAGILHAQATMQGDYIGMPAEPMYLFPPVYGAVGAFLGLLVDSAERERAAER